MNRFLALLLLLFCPAVLYAQPVFTLVTEAAGMADEGASHGAAWGDLDNDAWPDLLVANQENEANFLYHNNGDGTFTRLLDGPIATDTLFSAAVAWADFNGDGHLDVFVAEGSTDERLVNSLFRNNGDGTFTRMTPEATGDLLNEAKNTENAAWADFDNDGDLDLFVVNWSGQTNDRYQNDGQGRFTFVDDFTTVMRDYAVCANWCDVDGDGDADLFIARQGLGVRFEGRERGNLSSKNSLFRNDGTGRFRPFYPGQQSHRDPVAHDASQSITSSWGDIDNDGDFDLFVGNFAGEPNDLYRNNGDTTFTQITASPVARDGGVSLGSAFADFDNDGDLDLFVANGYGDPENNFFYLNDGSGVFTKVLEGPLVSGGGRSVATVAADYDNDGDLDLFVTDLDDEQPSRLYRNDTPGDRHWFKVRCVGTTSNTTALGARVEVTATLGGRRVRQTREIAQQTGFGGHHELIAHFGLADAAVIESLRITWPSGLVQTFDAVPADQDVTVVEGEVMTPTFP